MVRLYQTIHLHSQTRYVDIFYISSLMFDFTEPSVTTSSRGKYNYYVDFFHMSLVWFDYAEPFVTTSSRANEVCRYLLHEFVDV